ncbi:MAG: phytanoyl-CoA dioxygenase family protein [Pseudomonadota bacterium]
MERSKNHKEENSLQNIAREFECQGRHWFRQAVPMSDVNAFKTICPDLDRPGKRLPLRKARAAAGPALEQILGKVQLLLPGAFPTRVTAFAKSSATNWQVPWHQDRVIEVAERHEISDFHNWSRNGDGWHVEPPLNLLAGMLFVIVHLDAADSGNGCLQLAPKSHLEGKIEMCQAPAIAAQRTIETCAAKAGDLLCVKALTLHRSLSAKNSARRRTMRIDFAADPLPAPLSWQTAALPIA